jgi:alkylation response protein AidB-like acyl-CoA dehydrogenase
MSVADQGMAIALRGLNKLAGTEVLDRMKLRKPLERAIYSGSKNGFRAAGAASRSFTAATKLGQPKRLAPRRNDGLFDLTPDDEQQMLRESFSDFASQVIRPAAGAADIATAAPKELLDQAAELGLTMLGVPEELGGAVSERSAVTTVLIAEALAHGDMGIAVAALAPAAVGSALSLWGDAEQQAKYLPELVGENVPAAALAILEPQPLFDPFDLRTEATPGGILNGTKALVPRAAEAELFVVAAGRQLYIVESGAEGVFVESDPAMGVRAAATGRLILQDVQAEPLGTPDDYREAVQRARLAWCAVTVGTAQAVLDYVIPYVNERVAFGEPISHRQSVAFAVSNIAIEVEGMRLATYRAASLADQGKPFAKETALARQLCAKKGMFIGSEGLQLLGGHGYTREYPVERWYRDLRAAGVMEGALMV